MAGCLWCVVGAGCGATNTAVTVDMSVGDGDGDMTPPDPGDFATNPSTLTVTPLSAALAFGQSQPFAANRPVTWSVFEAGGGTITADGRYTAPSVAGTFHVHAVASDGSGDELYATVEVAEHALTFVAGGFGGLGTADGVGTAARFNGPQGLAYDGTQYLYIGDGGAVRRIDVATGAVTTVAGRPRLWTGNVDDVGPAAKFGTAYCVALDGEGAVYVTDFYNSTLRKVDLATRRVTTVAGQPLTPGSADGKGSAAQFNSPTGLAFDATKKIFYIGDSHNDAIRTYDPATTMVSTLTQVSAPDGIAFDGKNTLYVVSGSSLFKVDTNNPSVVALVAGGGRGMRDGVGAQAHFDNARSVALEGGAAWVNDILALRKIDLASGTVTSVLLRGGLVTNLIGVAGDGQGHIFVTTQQDNAVRRVDPAGGTDVNVAGPDGAGSGNVDGVGGTARLYNPGQVASDVSGAVYVSDVGNAEVRKIDLAATAVTTLAGTPWYSADVDGIGRNVITSAKALATDHAGTLFLIEPGSQTVRAWNLASNAVTTLAGRSGFYGIADGIGSAARFDTPVAACYDGGALYIADQNNFTVRKVVVATGAVSTIAGSAEDAGGADGIGAAARFSGPAGIACDGAGHVYVSDVVGYAIRRIDLATNTVDTPIGTLGARGYVDMLGTAARFESPGAMAFANGALYVLDQESSSVVHLRKIDIGTLAVSTLATSAHGAGIAVDGSGNPFVSDSTYGAAGVFAVAAGGNVTEIAGSAALGNGLVVDGIGAAANFFDADGMVFDNNALYVADATSGVVRRVDLSNNAVTTPLGVTANMPYQSGAARSVVLDAPAGLALANDSTLIFADGSTLDSLTLPPANVNVVAGKIGYTGGMDGVGAMATLQPSGVVSDGAGTVYFTGRNTVRRFDVASGTVDTIAGTEGTIGKMDGTKSAAQFYWPQGIALDRAGGILYVGDTFNHTIRKVVIATGDVTTLAGSGGTFGAVDDVGTAARFFYPKGLAYDGKGALYVADSENGAIRRVDVATGAVTTWAGVLGEKGLQPGPLPAHLNAPQGVALLPDGGLVVTDEQAVVVIH